MGKKAKLKQIRRLAGEMPVVKIKEVHGGMLPLNHKRKMKQAYNKFGMDGVRGYMAAVEDHVKRQQQPPAK